MGALLADIMCQWQAETPCKAARLGLSVIQTPGSETTHGFNYGAGLSASRGSKSRDFNGRDRRRFGFHNLRHSLASYLVTQTKTDVKNVQAMLRHADSGTTLDLYTHAIKTDKLVAQNQVMEAMMKSEVVN